MKTISAIYEGGVFRPTEPVDLPEHCRVRVEPVPMAGDQSDPKPVDLTPFRGLLKDSPIDPLEYQPRMRDEWD